MTIVLPSTGSVPGDGASVMAEGILLGELDGSPVVGMVDSVGAADEVGDELGKEETVGAELFPLRVGPMEGTRVGTLETSVGIDDGMSDMTEGRFEGTEEGAVEPTTGIIEGTALATLVGENEGRTLGVDDARTVGASVGNPLGATVGAPVGAAVGDSVGAPVGSPVGDPDGDPVGDPVGSMLGLAVGLVVGSSVGSIVGDEEGEGVIGAAVIGARESPSFPPANAK